MLPSLAQTPVLVMLAENLGLPGSLSQAGGRQGGGSDWLCLHSVLRQVTYLQYLIQSFQM